MKKEKRSLFNMIFGKSKEQQNENITQTQFQLLSGWNTNFSTLPEGTYNSKVARQVIDRIATHCAKLVPKHIQGSITNNIRGEINFLLSNQPNPIMNTFDFIYRIVSLLYTDCNAFVFIAKDSEGFITGFYPVLATNYKLLQGADGTMYLQFDFINGKIYTIPYLELIHLRLFYNRNDVFGTSNRVLQTDLNTADTVTQGIDKAIKTTSNLKGILLYENSMLKEKDLKTNKDNFVKDFLNMDNEGGIAALDAKAKFQEVNLKPITLDEEQLKRVNYNIFDYFGVSEKIVSNSFTEEEWNAFYEGVIESRAIQMSYAFTNKIFKRQSIKDGHRIVFTANRLQYASLNTKTNLLKVVAPWAMLKVDEGREILDLAPLGGEEGNRILQSLNNIDSSIANTYQVGGKNDGKSN
ncbi:MAG TPA: phage portal protein [Candidatus Tetragenococcus pullicola]|nr:phage portal protein [Candidatus Tetragenococcus pullicola]